LKADRLLGKHPIADRRRMGIARTGDDPNRELPALGPAPRSAQRIVAGGGLFPTCRWASLYPDRLGPTPWLEGKPEMDKKSIVFTS